MDIKAAMRGLELDSMLSRIFRGQEADEMLEE